MDDTDRVVISLAAMLVTLLIIVAVVATVQRPREGQQFFLNCRPGVNYATHIPGWWCE